MDILWIKTILEKQNMNNLLTGRLFSAKSHIVAKKRKSVQKNKVILFSKGGETIKRWIFKPVLL